MGAPFAHRAPMAAVSCHDRLNSGITSHRDVIAELGDLGYAIAATVAGLADSS